MKAIDKPDYYPAQYPMRVFLLAEGCTDETYWRIFDLLHDEPQWGRVGYDWCIQAKRIESKRIDGVVVPVYDTEIHFRCPDKALLFKLTMMA